MSRVRSASKVREEIDRFSAYAADWWNPDGAFRALHRMGPVRSAYIQEQVFAHFGARFVQVESPDLLPPKLLRNFDSPARGWVGQNGSLPRPFRGMRFLDAGCGGGVMAEELARLGAAVTGVDASKECVAAARRHAGLSGLVIDYRVSRVETFAESRGRYDVITALELVEHVADPDSLLGALKRLLKPGGLLILSTLNRTPKSFLFGVLAAEYLLGWAPPGSHDWSKFIRPSELARSLEALGFAARDVSGVVFDPLTGEFCLRPRRLGVNYFMTASLPVR